MNEYLSMETYRLTPQEQVHVRHSTPELLEAELLLDPGRRMPPAHIHPAQDERFEVLAGTLRVRLGRTVVEVGAGETLEIPRGTRHTMGATGGSRVKAIWQTRPALETERWWTALDAESRRSPDGHIPLVVMARLLQAHRREFQLALPRPLAAAFLGLLAMVPVRRRAVGVPVEARR
jgi:mannose-6-phosphate isomerase-like protein (cupin superfamily)